MPKLHPTRTHAETQATGSCSRAGCHPVERTRHGRPVQRAPWWDGQVAERTSVIQTSLTHPVVLIQLFILEGPQDRWSEFRKQTYFDLDQQTLPWLFLCLIDHFLAAANRATRLGSIRGFHS